MYRTIYALDANHIASACSPMTPLDLQQLFVCHNDHIWLSRTVPCCIYTIPRWDMTYGDSLGWTVTMSVVVRYNKLELDKFRYAKSMLFTRM